jgi:hypothetical protein
MAGGPTPAAAYRRALQAAGRALATAGIGESLQTTRLDRLPRLLVEEMEAVDVDGERQPAPRAGG